MCALFLADTRVKLRYMRYSTSRADYQIKDMTKAQVCRRGS